jgi:hypothetical protein
MTFQKMAAEVEKRSGVACEAPGCAGPDFRGLMLCHIVHRKMGGRHGSTEAIVNDSRNVAMLCGPHHDILDARVWQPAAKAALLEYLKKRLGWQDWKEEHANV